MGYMHINNLYKDQTLMMFKEVFCLEKVHGSSSHLGWNFEKNDIHYYAGGEKHENFLKVFNHEELITKFRELFPVQNIIVFGEVYGGKQQGMSATYGKVTKFVAFDVKVGDHSLNVPNAADVVAKLGLEFVDYVKTSTDLKDLDFQRDRDSELAVRNGMGGGKLREGIVIRPLIELIGPHGRLIAKHKRPEFSETRTPREVSPETLKVLTEAQEIADEWVTEVRLDHVLQKLPHDIELKDTRLVIDAMIEDVQREGAGEFIPSKEALKAIGAKAAQMFKRRVTVLK